jgi:hypothetical protein
VIEDVGKRVCNGVDILEVSAKIARENLDTSSRRSVAHSFDDAHKVRSTAVGKVITRHRRYDDMLEAQCEDRLGKARRLIGI